MSEFHKSRAWKKLAKDHKINLCIDCGTDKDITSGHILPVSRFTMSKLWKCNLVYQCQPCNSKQGTKLKFNLRTMKILGYYAMLKLLYYTVIILYFSLTTTVMYKDISTGGWETSFTGQILIEVWEYIELVR